MKKLSKNIYSLLTYRLLLLLVIYTISRILFIVLNNNLFDLSTPHFFQLLRAGLAFDVCVIMYINSLYILLQTIPFTFRYKLSYQKILKYLFVITNSIMLFFNCADIVYFRFIYRRTNLSVFSEFANDTSNFSLITQFAVDYWWVLLIWISIILVLIFLYGNLKPKKWNPKSKISYYLTDSLAMLLIIGVMFLGMRGKLDDRPLSINHASAKVNKAIETGIVLNTPFTLMRSSKGSLTESNTFSEKELSEIYTPIHKASISGKEFNPKNIVIIMLEGFGKAHTKYMPFIDSLSREGLSFKYSYANGVSSNDALPSVLVSFPALLPSTYVTTNYANNKLDGIAKTLAKKGYNSSFYHGAPNGSMRFLEFTKLIEFNDYYGQENFNNDAEFDGHWGIWDEPFLQFVANKINDKKAPSLTTVFTVTSHHPFRIPEKYKGKFEEGELPIHKTIGYTDYSVRMFFETAKTMPWYNNTLFVITADHTNGSTSEQVEYKTSTGIFSIPIIFFDPSNPDLKHYETEKMIQQIDIMPSILDYINYDEDYFAYGHSVFSDESTHFLVNQTNGIFQIYKDEYLLQTNNNEVLGLYKFKQDSLLTNNILRDNKEISEDMEKIFKAFQQQYNNRIISNKTTLGD